MGDEFQAGGFTVDEEAKVELAFDGEFFFGEEGGWGVAFDREGE